MNPITINLAQSNTPEANGHIDLLSNYNVSSANGTNTTKSKSKEDDHIKVICRFRPKNSKELAEEKRQNLVSNKEIEVYGEHTSLEIPRRDKRKPSLHFTLDSILWTNITQNDTFHRLAQQTVVSVVEGYNCTIFAFGQTGSGKTYTMFGPESTSLRNVEELGIIPRSVDYLFKLLNGDGNIMKYQVSLSIVEVYKEILRDLLLSSAKEKKNRKRLEILSAGKEIVVKNCTEKQCESVNDILSYIVLAQSNRAKQTTDFIGHDSSRSHCVVMISLTQRLLDDSIKFSKLNFGDLAGSELASKTGSSHQGLKEAGKIHQGLLALENVINALVEKKKHVPYNDSKLTRLLSTSIGGNSKTTLLVTCSPSIWNRDETISTLRFARRAKKIKNRAKINKRKTRQQLEQRIAYLEKENRELKQKLSKKKFGGGGGAVTTTTTIDTQETDKLKSLLRDRDAEVARLKNSLAQIEEDFSNKNDVMDEIDREKREYAAQCKKLSLCLSQRDAQIHALQGKLNTKIEFESKLNSHTQNLQNIVADSANSSSSMTSALTEITKQQTDFYGFLKTIADSIEKLHTKHDTTQKKRDVEIAEIKQMIGEMKEEEEIKQHHPQQSSLGFDLSFASGQLASQRRQSTTSNLGDLISTMRSYLEKANNEEEEEEAPITPIVISPPPAAVSLKREDEVAAAKQAQHFNIGKQVDVLDVSYVWYAATIVDIDVFERKAVYIKYDAFEENWNEWIPLKGAWRIAPAKSRIDVVCTLRGENDGIHCLIATKYGRSKAARDLQDVFSSDNVVLMQRRLTSKSVLMQGYVYKESPSKFRKTNWKRLWFVVQNNDTICYYDHKNMKSKQHRGVIRLPQISIVQHSKQKGFTNYSFDIITHKRKTRRFSCNSEQDLVDWMSVLQCLVYSDCHQIQTQTAAADDDDDANDTTKNTNSLRNALSINRNYVIQFFSDDAD
eukprot:608842_1